MEKNQVGLWPAHLAGLNCLSVPIPGKVQVIRKAFKETASQPKAKIDLSEMMAKRPQSLMDSIVLSAAITVWNEGTETEPAPTGTAGLTSLSIAFSSRKGVESHLKVTMEPRSEKSHDCEVQQLQDSAGFPLPSHMRGYTGKNFKTMKKWTMFN